MSAGTCNNRVSIFGCIIVHDITYNLLNIIVETHLNNNWTFCFVEKVCVMFHFPIRVSLSLSVYISSSQQEQTQPKQPDERAQ